MPERAQPYPRPAPPNLHALVSRAYAKASFTAAAFDVSRETIGCQIWRGVIPQFAQANIRDRGWQERPWVPALSCAHAGMPSVPVLPACDLVYPAP